MLKTSIPDGQSRVSEDSERSPLHLGDDRYSSPGSGKVEEEIRLRHSSPTSGGQGHSERSLGWRDGDIGFICLEGTQKVDEESGEYPAEFLYDRVGSLPLGEAEENEPREPSVRRCFNCGEPNHVVTDCPSPANPELIALTRAMYMFFRPAMALGQGERLHTVEGWKHTRLSWVDEFNPGIIRGELLRSALGLEDAPATSEHPWLFEMLRWGYPPGWVADSDPREDMRRRIRGTTGWDDDDLLEVFDDLQGDSIPLLVATHSRRSPTVEWNDKQTRYASYETDLFSSSMLRIYNGIMLPPVGDERPRTPPTPPWRVPGAMGQNSVPPIPYTPMQSALAYSQYYIFYHNPTSYIQPPYSVHVSAQPVPNPTHTPPPADSDEDMDLSE